VSPCSSRCTRAGSGDFVEFGRRIASLCHDDPHLERGLFRWIDDPVARQAILDAFAGG